MYVTHMQKNYMLAVYQLHILIISITKSVIDLAKTETGSFQGSSFLQSIKETANSFMKLELTGETVSGPGFTDWNQVFVCLLVQDKT